MDANVLSKLFGTDRQWAGTCTVVLDADAHVQSIGSDAIVQGGVKAYSPRLITGRIPADHALWLPDQNAMVIVRRTVSRQHTGEDLVNHTVQVVSAAHIAAVEFDKLDALGRLGLTDPWSRG